MQGVSIRRVSLRARNMDNRPDAWEAEILRRLERQASRGEPLAEETEADVLEQGKAYYRFLKPIRVQAMCLSCHGQREEMHEGVGKLLAERYPKDQATGYRAGDLRGAFSVKILR